MRHDSNFKLCAIDDGSRNVFQGNDMPANRGIYRLILRIPSTAPQMLRIGNVRSTSIDVPSRTRLSRPNFNNVFAAIILIVTSAAVAVADTPVSYLRESKFQAALDRPLIATGQRARLKDYLIRLSQERQVAILLDRRVDPTQLVDVSISADFFDHGIADLVAQAECGVSLVGDTVYVGPSSTAAVLRTRIALLREQLNQAESLTPKRQFELLRRYPMEWEMFASPAELLIDWTSKFDVHIENPEAIPHDLWAAGTVADPNLIEGVTIVLTQFDLSFEWQDDSTIRLVPQAPRVAIAQVHRPRRIALEEAVQRVRAALPQLELDVQGGSLKCTGTVEQHETVAVLIGEKPARRRSKSTTELPLQNRRFTLRMVRQPFGSLLATLEQQGIDVHVETRELPAAGVDLATKISLELEQATIEQLLSAACDKVGLDFEIREETIFLRPRPEE